VVYFNNLTTEAQQSFVSENSKNYLKFLMHNAEHLQDYLREHFEGFIRGFYRYTCGSWRERTGSVLSSCNTSSASQLQSTTGTTCCAGVLNDNFNGLSYIDEGKKIEDGTNAALTAIQAFAYAVASLCKGSGNYARALGIEVVGEAMLPMLGQMLGGPNGDVSCAGAEDVCNTYSGHPCRP